MAASIVPAASTSTSAKVRWDCSVAAVFLPLDTGSRRGICSCGCGKVRQLESSCLNVSSCKNLGNAQFFQQRLRQGRRIVITA